MPHQDRHLLTMCADALSKLVDLGAIDVKTIPKTVLFNQRGVDVSDRIGRYLAEAFTQTANRSAKGALRRGRGGVLLQC